MIKTETLTSIAIALLVFIFGSGPAQAHGKGIYSTEAEAKETINTKIKNGRKVWTI